MIQRDGIGDKVIPKVPNNDDRELFEDSLEIEDDQKEENRARGGRVIKRHTHLDDYRIYLA